MSQNCEVDVEEGIQAAELPVLVGKWRRRPDGLLRLTKHFLLAMYRDRGLIAEETYDCINLYSSTPSHSIQMPPSANS